MPQLTLADEEYNEVLRLARLYRREADKCRESKAFLAGCVMTGAALEAMLLATANCFPERALASKAAPRIHGAIKPLMNWSLAQLLAVAKECAWLPSGLSLEDEWNTARAEIGDYAEVVRKIRNYVHPARYTEDFGGKKITGRYLESSFKIIDSVNNYLMNAVLESLHQLADSEQGGA